LIDTAIGVQSPQAPPTPSRPVPSTLQQWWVLTTRAITPTLRNGELVTQVAASIMFTVGFYIPLKQVMGVYAQGMSSYAQYLMPLIALQAIAFASVSAAFPVGHGFGRGHQPTVSRPCRSVA
jgi:hypothetical protein